MGSRVGLGRVKLEVENLVEKYREPLAKLGAKGIQEWVATAPANQRRVVAVVTEPP
jgi:hypothetical protein